jgi:hypothetical protein
MRTSCDIDILVAENDLTSAVNILTRELNYIASDKKDYHDISLFSGSGVHIELHYSLCENMSNIDELLSRAWEYVINQDEYYEKRFEDAYFLFHITAHMLYHFQHGGCGIRPLLDLWLLKGNFTKIQFDTMLNQCGIKVFYQTMVELSECWFGRGALTETTKKVQDYLLEAGVYGAKRNRELADTVKSGSKVKRVMRYIFLPYDNMVIVYPILKKAKILLPFFHVWRWITRLFRIGKAAKKTQEILGQDTGDLGEIRILFEMLDI